MLEVVLPCIEMSFLKLDVQEMVYTIHVKDGLLETFVFHEW